jgi:hypothetical protein
MNRWDPSGLCNWIPWSTDNCVYEAVTNLVDNLGVDAGSISAITGVVGGLLTVTGVEPLGIPLEAISAATGAYSAGESFGSGDSISGALEALGAALGGASAGLRFLKVISEFGADYGIRTIDELVVDKTAAQQLAERLSRDGFILEAEAILTKLANMSVKVPEAPMTDPAPASRC